MLQAVGGIYDGNYAVLNMGGQGNNKRFLDKRIAVGPGVDMTGTINFQPASAGNTGTIFHLSTDGVWTSASGLPAYLVSRRTTALEHLQFCSQQPLRMSSTLIPDIGQHLRRRSRLSDQVNGDGQV